MAAQLFEESLPLDVQGCILASEGPAEPAEIEYILSNLPSLKKCATAVAVSFTISRASLCLCFCLCVYKQCFCVSLRFPLSLAFHYPLPSHAQPSALLGRVVFLSVVGVDRRDNLLFKFNPFLSIGKWCAAAPAQKGVAGAEGRRRARAWIGAGRAGECAGARAEDSRATAPAKQGSPSLRPSRPPSLPSPVRRRLPC